MMWPIENSRPCRQSDNKDYVMKPRPKTVYLPGEPAEVISGPHSSLCGFVVTTFEASE